MEIKIFTRSGGIRHTTDDSRKESTRSQQLMGDNLVSIVFDHDAEIQFKSGDYITWQGEHFTLLDDYYPTRKNDVAYHYELKFEGPEGLLKTIPFFRYVTLGDKTGKEPEFSYVGNLQLFANFVVKMLRTATGDETWTAAVAKDSESKSVSFSATNFFDALASIADTFGTEWWLTGKTLHFGRCETGDLQTFRAGESLTSVEIPQNNETIPNRIFAYGSTRNITPEYTSQGVAYNKRLHLPAGTEYVEVTGGGEHIVSQIVYFDNDKVGDIYPSYTGTISEVQVEKNSDNTIYYFKDKDIDFDPKEQLIEGTTMMVHFESGMLQGRDFEVAWHGGSKCFEIINTQEGDIQVPFGLVVPAKGDKYVPWNMKMPASYITAAEQRLKQTAQKYVDDLNAKTPDITCRAAEGFFTTYGKNIGLGSRVKIEDTRLKDGYVQSRVSRYSYPLYCPQQVEFTLSENVAAGRLNRIENKIEDLTSETKSSIQFARSISRRAYRDATELAATMDSLQKELVLVSNPNSQFATTCVFKTNKYNDPNLLSVSAGTLQHTVHLGTTDGLWVIEGAEHTLIEDEIYYVYFKCSKTSTKGYVIISPMRLALEEEEGAYLFLGGVVSSVFENARIVNIVSGFTQIAGGNITAERIQDATKRLIIDLSANPPSIIARQGARLIGDFTFESASGLDNIEGIDDMKTDISKAQSTAAAALLKAQQTKDYIDTTLPGEIQEINRRLDGVVENWFYPYSPYPTNEPAKSWTTPEAQEQHLGDTFTNTLPADFDPQYPEQWEQGTVYLVNDLIGKTYEEMKGDSTVRLRSTGLINNKPGVRASVAEGYRIAAAYFDADRKYRAHWDAVPEVLTLNYPYVIFSIKKTDESVITTADLPNVGLTFTATGFSNPDAGKSWRWVKEDDTYKWTQIADSDAVKALQEAVRAQDTADAKRRVFVAQPKPPYDVGDIWSQGANGDILRCIKSRATGAFDSADWDKAAKYTDDTVAQEAKARLAAMASDSMLSREEKPAVRQQWAQIQKEYAKYQVDATTCGVSAAALKTAFDALTSYLTDIALTSDTDTAITPDVFNQKFADYYAEVSRFSNLVAQKKADEAVDNLQIGTRNYIAKQFIREWNSRKEGITDAMTAGTDADGAYLAIDANKASNAGIATPNTGAIATWSDCFKDRIKYKPGVSYIFKARIKQPKSARGIVFCAVYEDNTYQFMSEPPSLTLSDLYEVVYTTTPGKSLRKIVPYVVAWNPIYLYDIQLTEGNKAPTGYLTAEEDVQYAIDQAQAAAAAADAMLADIASDSKFTPSEKQQTQLEWERIKAEYQQSLTQAQTYKIPTSTLTSSYNLLSSYIAPLLSDLNTTSDIVGSTFRKKFSDFYTANKNILNQVAETIATQQDSLKTEINETEYIKALFSKGKTSIAGGVVLTSAVAILEGGEDVDDEGPDDEKVVAMMNGAKKYSCTTHGIALHILGMNGIKNWKEANTIMYQDGTIISKSLELKEGCKLGPFDIRAGNAPGIYLESTFGIKSVVAHWVSDHFDFYMSQPGAAAQGYTNTGNFMLGSAGATPDGQRTHVLKIFSPGKSFAGLCINTFDKEALVIESGHVMGLRINPRKITGSTTLTDMDYCIVYDGGSRITITLPQTPRLGQRYEIIKDTLASMTINGVEHPVNRVGISFNALSQTITDYRGVIYLQYDQSSGSWYMTLVSGTGA